ncbi:MAG TPA: Uma2 family endonuclease [Polyangia bacterium]|jgi:Uma2 family endonuclease
MRPEPWRSPLSGEEFHRRHVGERVELWDGEVIPMTPVSSAHARTAAMVAFRLQHAVGPAGERGAVLVEAGFLLERDPDVVLAPDVAVVRPGRELPPRGWIPGAPDLAVEVLSPDDAWRDLVRKVGRYLEAGTALAWVLDPERRRVVVFRPDEPPATLAGEDPVVGAPVLDGLVLRAAELFPVP